MHSSRKFYAYVFLAWDFWASINACDGPFSLILWHLFCSLRNFFLEGYGDLPNIKEEVKVRDLKLIKDPLYS